MDAYIRQHNVSTEAARREAYREAYRKLPQDEQIVIDEMADAIVKLMKGRNQRIMMSAEGAREILAAVGIWIVKFERGIK